MKKIIAIILLLHVAILSFTGCGNKEPKKDVIEYNELGLYYTLPPSFVEKEVPYGDMNYSDQDSGGSGYFFFSVFSSEGLEENQGVRGDITVKEYMTEFIGWKDIRSEYSYDVTRDIAAVDYVYTYPDGEFEDEYYLHIVMRGTDHLYLITMSCNYADFESTYKQIFTEIRASISAQ